MSLLRKMINIGSDLVEIFTPTNRGYVDSRKAISSGLSETDTLVPVTTAATVIVAENLSRSGVQLQNQGIYPIKVKVYSVAGTEDFNFILAAASGVDAGDGAPWDSQTIQGNIWGITEAGESIVSVMEEVI